MSISLIVGLGNPGSEYTGTRHNVGFWWLDHIARHERLSFRPDKKFHGEVARLAAADCWLLKPQTYMNRSGQAVVALAQFYKIPASNILVVHDELDIPPGTTRLKLKGGHGGHNGLRDITQKLGSQAFMRLRIGIGHPGDKSLVANYVLRKPSKDDLALIDKSLDNALTVLPLVLAGKVDKAMNQLHSPTI